MVYLIQNREEVLSLMAEHINLVEQPVKVSNLRYKQFLNDQVNRIQAFEKTYEEKHGEKLLALYPYGIDERPEESDAVDGTIEQLMYKDIKWAVEEAGEDVEQAKLLQELGTYDTDADALRSALYHKGLVSSKEVADEAFNHMLTAIEGRDNPILDRVKDQTARVGKLLVTQETRDLTDVQEDLDTHYVKFTRPSDQMEQLIVQAEQEARTLDRTLDTILKLEDQGVVNPLNDPDIHDSSVEQVSGSDRELLKSLFRKKQAVAPKASTTPDPSQGMDR